MKTNYSSSHRGNPQLSQRQSQLPFRFGLLLTAIGILLVSRTSSQPPDPITVVQTACEHFNEGDVDGFIEQFSDDDVVVDDRGRLVGSEAIRAAVGLKLRYDTSESN